MLYLRVEKVEDGRVGEPGRDQRARIGGTSSLPESGRSQGPELGVDGEAGRDRRLVLGGNPGNQPLANGASHLINV